MDPVLCILIKISPGIYYSLDSAVEHISMLNLNKQTSIGLVSSLSKRTSSDLRVISKCFLLHLYSTRQSTRKEIASLKTRPTIGNLSCTQTSVCSVYIFVAYIIIPYRSLRAALAATKRQDLYT